MRKFIIAAVAANLLGTAAASTAEAGGCYGWVCGSNGTQLDGIRIEGARAGALVATVTLPSGEVLGLGTDEANKPRLRIADKKNAASRIRAFEKEVEDNDVTFDELLTFH